MTLLGHLHGFHLSLIPRPVRTPCTYRQCMALSGVLPVIDSSTMRHAPDSIQPLSRFQRTASGRRLQSLYPPAIPQLQTKRTRSVAEQELLVENVAYLLISLSMFISKPKGASGSPEDRVRGRVHLTDTFREAHLDDVRALRYGILRRAADVALGEEANA